MNLARSYNDARAYGVFTIGNLEYRSGEIECEKLMQVMLDRIGFCMKPIVFQAIDSPFSPDYETIIVNVYSLISCADLLNPYTWDYVVIVLKDDVIHVAFYFYKDTIVPHSKVDVTIAKSKEV